MTRRLVTGGLIAFLSWSGSACGSDEARRTVAPPVAPPVCDAYAAWPRSHATCLAHAVLSIATPAAAIALCEEGGTEAKGCRHAWVVARAGRTPNVAIEDLLAVCGADGDCAMEALDLCPDPDIRAQLRRCEAHAGAFADDCVGHAMERWWHRGPDAAAIESLASETWSIPETVGTWIGVAVACGGGGTCGSQSVLAASCERRRAALVAEKFGCRRMSNAGK